MNTDLFRMLWRVSAGNVRPFPHVSEEDFALLRRLRRSGYVRFDRTGDFSITPSGKAALLKHDEGLSRKREQEAKKRAQQDAEKDEQRRLRTNDIWRSWWQFFLGLVLGWLLGGFTPQEVFQWLVSLFK